jgi:hypothetical protein
MLVAIAALAGTSSAQAATFCVPVHGALCQGTDEPTIQDALQAASQNNSPSSTTDTIRVAAGTYSGPFVDSLANPVILVGSGDQTVLDDPSGGTHATTLSVADTHSVASSLKVLAPSGSAQTALAMSGIAVHVTVVEDGTSSGATGVQLNNGTFDQGSIALGDPTSAGVSAFGGTLSRSRITAAAAGISTQFGVLAVDDVVRLTGSSGTALRAASSFNTSISARQVTLIGPATAGSTGVDVQASIAFGSFTPGFSSGALDGVLVRGFGTDLRATGQSGQCGIPGDEGPCTAQASITVVYSDFSPARAVEGTAGTINDGFGNLHDVDPGFRNAPAGDFSLRRGSPAVDRGNPAAPPAGDPTTDAAGQPRKVDGDSDQQARIDMGAFELAPRQPPVAVIRGPAVVVVHRPIRFDGRRSHDPEGAPLSYHWSFGDGGSATGDRPAHRYSKTGHYRVRLVVTSSFGLSSPATSMRIVVSRAPLCVVPRLRGRTLAGARRALSHAHCTLGHKSRRHSPSVASGRVIASQPPRGTRLAHGARVAIVLSTGR